MQFLIDTYSPDTVSGINANLIRATATPDSLAQTPGGWKVNYKDTPLSQVQQQQDFPDRGRAVAGLCELLGADT